MFGWLYGPRLTTASSSASLSELDKVSALKESVDGLDHLVQESMAREGIHVDAHSGLDDNREHLDGLQDGILHSCQIMAGGEFDIGVA